VIVEGEHRLAAPRAIVWDVVNDPAAVASATPGVESFDVRSDGRWTADARVPLGPTGLRMKLDFRQVEVRELEYIRLAISGSGPGAMLTMLSSFTLSDQDDGTAMAWQADVKIGGTVGAMGLRVLRPIVRQQISGVLAAFDQEVERALARSPMR
jgi:carbon monoxide dehydrogenase subunit G